MDFDNWFSRLAAAKRQFALLQSQTSHLDRLCVDDFDGEDEIRPEFPCPYCYEDNDITSLCLHLEEKHSFESRVSMCPICAVKVSRDMLGHITLLHGHLFKPQRRRRSRRAAISNSRTPPLLGRGFRETYLQVLLNGSGCRSNNSTASNGVDDPLLSSLILNFPSSHVEDISKSLDSNCENTSSKNVTSPKIWRTSFDPSLSVEEREIRIKEAASRAEFVQDLIGSTIFGE